jgi:hypothetical protein
MDNLAPDEAGDRLAPMRPCQLHANCEEKIRVLFQLVIPEARSGVRRRARTAEH